MKLSSALVLSLFASLLLAGATFAQSPIQQSPFGVDRPVPVLDAGRNCGTPIPTEQEQFDVRDATARFMRMRQADPFAAQAVGGQIKVAFHVVYSGSEGNIPQSQIDAQIAELNKAYSGFYGGVNTGYTFVLASVDRTNNRRWFKPTPGSNAEVQMKNALAIDPTHRLNVYTCKPGQNLLGWSYFPWSYAENNKIHGVVMHYASVPGGSLAPYNLGGTLDHEAGHYLGLYHTFQGGCTAPGDEVADTPFEANPTSGCPNGKDTCPTTGLDPIHNYMDYSTDACYTQFTAGQDARMDQMVPQYRPSLLNAAIAADLTAEPAPENASVMPALRGGSVQLRGAVPNPFRSESNVFFTLPSAQHVSLKVYSISGQLVRTLVDEERAAGEQSAKFDGHGLPAGMYYTVLRSGASQLSRSVILVQ
jgi:hypothetical protein